MPAEAVTNMENFGINLGYAYQIMDDVLDYVSDASLLGKPAGNDLTQGNVTLPVLHALQQPEAGAWLRDVIETRNINDQALLQIKRILIECGSIDYAVSRSRRFLAEALKNLHYLPSGLIRNELEALAWYLMDEYFNQLQAGNPVIKQEAVESGRTLQ
jgi:heptaprenyl diphosphate synthase